jgi:hypothetical protein
MTELLIIRLMLTGLIVALLALGAETWRWNRGQA